MKETNNQGLIKESSNDACKGIRSMVEGEKGLSKDVCKGVRSIVEGEIGIAQEDANSKCCSKNAILITKNQYLCQ
jgi:hypothetical protein